MRRQPKAESAIETGGVVVPGINRQEADPQLFAQRQATLHRILEECSPQSAPLFVLCDGQPSGGNRMPRPYNRGGY